VCAIKARHKKRAVCFYFATHISEIAGGTEQCAADVFSYGILFYFGNSGAALGAVGGAESNRPFAAHLRHHQSGGDTAVIGVFNYLHCTKRKHIVGTAEWVAESALHTHQRHKSLLFLFNVGFYCRIKHRHCPAQQCIAVALYLQSLDALFGIVYRNLVGAAVKGALPCEIKRNFHRIVGS